MAIIDRNPPPCVACHALGSFEHDGVQHELNFCLLRRHSIPVADPVWPTVMARFGPGDEDFTDGIGAADSDPVLGEAKRRAIEQGLYDPAKPLHPRMQQAVEVLAQMIVDQMLDDAGETDPTARGEARDSRNQQS